MRSGTFSPSQLAEEHEIKRVEFKACGSTYLHVILFRANVDEPALQTHGCAIDASS